MPSAPSGERPAPGGARATRPNATPEAPIGVKVIAGLLVLGAFADAFVGLLAIETTGVLGVPLLGVALAELYLAYGCYYLQEWAYRATIAVQAGLLVAMLLLGQAALVLFKVVLLASLLAKRDAGWY